MNDNVCDSDNNNDNYDSDDNDKVWFLTRALDGLLLYNGGKPSGGGDFISLNLVSFINNIIISTDGVLRNPMTYDNHPSIHPTPQSTDSSLTPRKAQNAF